MSERHCPYCASPELRLVWDKTGLLLWCQSCYRLSRLESGCDLAALPRRATQACRRNVTRSVVFSGLRAPDVWATHMRETFGEAARPIVKMMIATEADSVQQWQEVLARLERMDAHTAPCQWEQQGVSRDGTGVGSKARDDRASQLMSDLRR